MLRRCPSGDLLDYLYHRLEPRPGQQWTGIAPGATRNPPGINLTAAYLRREGLYGQRIIAATTTDRATLQTALTGPATVVQAAAWNPNLTAKEAAALYKRAVSNRDERLANALVAARHDIGNLASDGGAIFDLLSRRAQQGGVARYARNLLQMNLTQLKAVEALNRESARWFFNEACTQALGHVTARSGGLTVRCGVDVGVLVELVQRGTRRGSFEPTPGLDAALSKLPDAKRKIVERYCTKFKEDDGTDFGKGILHDCDFDTLQALAGLAKIADPAAGKIHGALHQIARLDAQAQLAMIAKGKQAEEILHHFPETRRAAVGSDNWSTINKDLFLAALVHQDAALAFVDGVETAAPEDLQTLLDRGDLLGVAHDILVDTELPSRNPVARISFLYALAAKGNKYRWDSGERWICEVIPRGEAKQVLDAMYWDEGREQARQDYLGGLARDNFAEAAHLEDLLDLKLDKVPFIEWGEPARNWAADQVAACMHEGTIDEFFDILRKEKKGGGGQNATVRQVLHRLRIKVAR